MQPKQPYLTTLTPLRGIAALLVVVFHCNLMCYPFMKQGALPFIENGWLWVDFFFVLSGFIMSYVYANTFKEGIKANAFWKYVGARFARVYPLHFVTLIWAVIIAMIIRSVAQGMDPFLAALFDVKRGFPLSLFLLQSMHTMPTAPLNTPSWSLSTEWWMYMLFPAVVLLFTRLKAWSRILALVVVAGMFVALRYVVGPMSADTGKTASINMIADFSFLRCFCGFVLGMLTYEFYKANTLRAFFSRDIIFILFFAGVFVALQYSVMDIVVVGIFPLILLSAAHNNGRIKQMLDTKPLQRLGDWSFSIYMLHVCFIMLVWLSFIVRDPLFFSDFNRWLNYKWNYNTGLLLCGIIITVTIIASSLVYKFVEVPARNYLNRRFARKEKQISLEPAQA